MSDLVQVLTDPENQPNQYGFECFMKGQKMAFKIGNQSFTLDYEPYETDEFNFMRDMLANAFSTFTPDVKNARIEQLERVLAQAREALECATKHHTTTSLPLAIERFGTREAAQAFGMRTWMERIPNAIATIDEAMNHQASG